MIFRHGALSRRDAFLLLIGASSMHIWSLLFSHHSLSTDVDAAALQQVPAALTTTVRELRTKTIAHTQIETATATVTTTALSTPTSKALALSPHTPLPPTEVLAHAPGWTLFRNLYMSNGTLFLAAKDSATRMGYPEIRMMTSTGLEAFNTPENIALREPTSRDMQVIGIEEAQRRWVDKEGGVNRVWSVEGNTLLFNDPKQFLRHYYHLVAELFFGVQAFWHGAFSAPTLASDTQAHFTTEHPAPPPLHRAIFIHSDADGWRDDPGFNRYFLRGVFPSLVIEHEEDWEDRVAATSNLDANGGERAFHFPLALLTDRSAAHRGPVCGSQTQRTAAEAWEYMRGKGKLRGLHVGGWWAPVREAMWRFAGAEEGLKGLKENKGVRQGEEGERPSTDGPFPPRLGGSCWCCGCCCTRPAVTSRVVGTASPRPSSPAPLKDEPKKDDDGFQTVSTRGKSGEGVWRPRRGRA
ncbi:hypothetical protein NLJ89_g6968 [Agrocybe chaxingu]|uniref:Uncharacterized protein n=1 Tax=Agrocybe chaxingu TaxID=84603 RepID=A0A9W8MU54_9AGAR|nr:hypothetical protein NLJ89_g6968 [Agrocybe chaxingu]